MGAGLLAIGLVVATLGMYLMSFAWFLLKVFLGIGIAWGFIQSIDPPPSQLLAQLHMWVAAIDPEFPGGQYLFWIAANWWQFAIGYTALMVADVRRLVPKIVETSGHAAFAASALANYLNIEPTTKRFLNMHRNRLGLLASFVEIMKQGIGDRLFSIFAGVPFLPDQAMPGRNGEVARFRDDVEQIIGGARGDPHEQHRA